MITQSCSRGNVSDCGCDRRKKVTRLPDMDWKWGGCSVDVRYGTRLAKKFIDSREMEGDARSLMNLHNNQAGRKVGNKNFCNFFLSLYLLLNVVVAWMYESNHAFKFLPLQRNRFYSNFKSKFIFDRMLSCTPLSEHTNSILIFSLRQGSNQL